MDWKQPDFGPRFQLSISGNFVLTKYAFQTMIVAEKLILSNRSAVGTELLVYLCTTTNDCPVVNYRATVAEAIRKYRVEAMCSC